MANDGRRLVAALVVGAHAGLLAVALGYRAASRPDAPPTLIFVQPIHLPQTREPPRVQPSRAAAVDQPAPARAIALPPVPMPPDEAPDIPSVAPSTPRVDWQAELERAARAAASALTEPKDDPLDSRPQVLTLPQRDSPSPRKGDIHVQPDGSMRVWMNDDGLYCDFRQPLLMNQFEIWARSIPPTCGRRALSAPALPAFRQPEYLSRPLPEPGGD